jgi:ribosomal protein S18 acetylase RimI-like enzyme
LAVARAYQGLKLGGALLWDPIDRAARSKVAVYALVVDAKDEAAERFYRHHGFMVLSNAPITLILPLAKRKR